MNKARVQVVFSLLLLLTCGAIVGYAAIPQNTIRQNQGAVFPTLNATAGFFVGPNMIVSAARAASFVTLNTGQGTNELYPMDQGVRTSDDVQFHSIDVQSVLLNSVNITDEMALLRDSNLGLINFNQAAYFDGRSVTPNNAEAFGARYTDADYQVIPIAPMNYIHDLINDPLRNCIWGITRADANINYIFRVDRDGTITRQALGGVGENRGMFLGWVDGYLYAAILEGSTGKLLRFNPETWATDYYSTVIPAVSGASCLTFNGTDILLGVSGATKAPICIFNIASGTFTSTFDITDVKYLYWAVFDGEYSWFGGTIISTNKAGLVKIAPDGSYTVYDVGTGALDGGEITYDGRYIWCCNRDQNTVIRFDPQLATYINFKLNPWVTPRLIEFNGKDLWIVGSNKYVFKMDPETGATTPLIYLSVDFTYSHGLAFDGVNVWLGSWQSTSYIWKIPAYTQTLGGMSFIRFDGNQGNMSFGETKYVDTYGLSATESITQIPINTPCQAVYISANILGNTLNSTTIIRIRKNGASVGGYFSVPAGGTGVILQNFNSPSTVIPTYFSVGDLLSVIVTTSGTDGSILIGKIIVTIYG